MKKITYISLCFMSLFILFGCGIVIHNNIHIPEFTEFTQNESFYYTTTENKYLNADINSCTTRIEFLSYDGADTFVEVAYNEQSVRDKINFSYTDGELHITKANSTSRCGIVTKIDSYVRISIPKVMNNVTIDIVSYNSKAVFTDISATDFTYKHINGDVTVNKGNITTGSIDITNGTVTADDVTGDNFTLKSVNGNLNIYKAVYTQKITAGSSNGYIKCDDIKTPVFTGTTTNGNVSLENSEITGSAEAKSTNGNVQFKSVNVNLTDSTGSFRLTTTNGKVTLTDAYPVSAVLKTVNGDISYTNTNKAKSVTVTYSKVNGSTHFDINGSIDKI